MTTLRDSIKMMSNGDEWKQSNGHGSRKHYGWQQFPLHSRILDSVAAQSINDKNYSKMSFPLIYWKNAGRCAIFKTEVVLNSDSISAFVYLMSCGSRTKEEFYGDDSPRISRVGNINSSSHSFMSGTDAPLESISQEFCVIESISEHEDVIHCRQIQPLFLFPSWTERRDWCLWRSWRVEEDGSYIITMRSVEHDECPIYPGFVRSDMQMKYRIISRQTEIIDGFVCNDSGNLQCIVKQQITVDPRGWIPQARLINYHSFADAFAISLLLQIIDFGHSVETNQDTDDRFIFPERASVSHLKTLQRLATLEPELVYNRPDNEVFFTEESAVTETIKESRKGDSKETSKRTSISILKSMSRPTFLTIVPILEQGMWEGTDASLWKVRGKKYKTDKKKYAADKSVFRLAAIDLVEVDEPILTGMCGHPTERVQRCLELEKKYGENTLLPNFIVAFNIFVPGRLYFLFNVNPLMNGTLTSTSTSGPPHYHLVVYFEVPKERMEDLTGKSKSSFSNLASKFFFGEDDTFRDRRKYIIVLNYENFFVSRHFYSHSI